MVSLIALRAIYFRKRRNMAKKLDPIIAAYLKKVKSSYNDWIETAFWQFVRETCTNKKSEEYKTVTDYVYQKLQEEAYLQANIGNISFDQGG